MGVIVSVRFTPTELEAMDELVWRGRYTSRSKLISDAVEALLLKEHLNREVFHRIRRERPARRMVKAGRGADRLRKPTDDDQGEA